MKFGTERVNIYSSVILSEGGSGLGGGGVWVEESRTYLGVIVVRVFEPIFRNLHHSYTWPLKNGPIHILDHLKC